MSEYVVYMSSDTGEGVAPSDLSYVEGRRSAGNVKWCGADPIWWAVNQNHPVRTVQTSTYGRWGGIGDVRLDNRREVRRATGMSADTSDLLLAMQFIALHGTARVGELLGDFAFVMWDHQARELIAIRDAIGVKPLFYRNTTNGMLFASRASLISSGCAWNAEYIAEFLLHLRGGLARTIYDGVVALQPGTVLHTHLNRLRLTQYWDARAFPVDERTTEAEAIEQFRSLFTEAVQVRVDGPAVWSHLSGGLDSSSIVCIADELAHRGEVSDRLAGTLTIVDDIGFRDEVHFVDAILAEHPLINKRFVDWWAWRDCYGGPPMTDQPELGYSHFALEEELCSAVTNENGQVLLSGIGADHYLKGALTYLADLVAAGHPIRATRETAAWAIGQRRSFWRLFYRQIVIPSLPTSLQMRLIRHRMRVPSWIRESYAKQLDIRGRLKVVREHAARRGKRGAERLLGAIDAIPHQLYRGVSQERLEMRYPFLARPLVELGLSLRPSLRCKPAKPNQQKWILRCAMRGTLPEMVRTRTAKATAGGRFLWSLSREAQRIDLMLKDPLLAQMGFIEPMALRKAVADSRRGRTRRSLDVFGALTLEAWLRARSGQWIAHEGIDNELKPNSLRGD